LIIWIETKYLVEVFTGDEKYGGTDAEVFLTIYGEKSDTSEKHLAKSNTHFDKFERNHVIILNLFNF